MSVLRTAAARGKMRKAASYGYVLLRQPIIREGLPMQVLHTATRYGQPRADRQGEIPRP